MMKMNDHFNLPVDDEDVESLGAELSPYQVTLAAVHAINYHDRLVSAVDIMINNLGCADIQAIKSLLDEIKSA